MKLNEYAGDLEKKGPHWRPASLYVCSLQSSLRSVLRYFEYSMCHFAGITTSSTGSQYFSNLFQYVNTYTACEWWALTALPKWIFFTVRLYLTKLSLGTCTPKQHPPPSWQRICIKCGKIKCCLLKLFSLNSAPNSLTARTHKKYQLALARGSLRCSTFRCAAVLVCRSELALTIIMLITLIHS